MTLRLPCARSADMESDSIDLAFSKDTLIHADSLWKWEIASADNPGSTFEAYHRLRHHAPDPSQNSF